MGWFIPKYVAEAHPEIKTVSDALKHPELFPDGEDASRGAIMNGPQGWGMTVATSQLYKAYDAEASGFTLVDTGSAAGLDASIAKAYERKDGWLGAYWALQHFWPNTPWCGCRLMCQSTTPSGSGAFP